MKEELGRRAFLKVACITAAAATVSQAYDKKLIVNDMDMKIMNPEKPTKLELKHSAEITIGEKDSKGFSLVQVEVGQEGIIHPSIQGHWIYQIVLYADDKKVAVADLEPEISRGYLSARVNLTNVKKLSATTKCNLHGNYTASIDV